VPPIFGRAAITLGIGPHSSFTYFLAYLDLQQKELYTFTLRYIAAYRLVVRRCRTAWLVILMSSLAAFVYTSADCLLDYMSQRIGNHGDEPGDVSALPAFTICNLNPLRSAGVATRHCPGISRESYVAKLQCIRHSLELTPPLRIDFHVLRRSRFSPNPVSLFT